MGTNIAAQPYLESQGAGSTRPFSMPSVYFVTHSDHHWHVHAWINGVGGAYHMHDEDLDTDFRSVTAAVQGAVAHARDINAPLPLKVISVDRDGESQLLYRMPNS